MAARVVQEVELGFLEIPEDLLFLTSSHLPSKVGGKPAWLDHAHLPRPEDLACGCCQKPLTFLLQIYAPVPVDETKPEGDEYRRTLFVFMCRDASCHGHGVSKCFKVFRCQEGPAPSGLCENLPDKAVKYPECRTLSQTDSSVDDELPNTSTLTNGINDLLERGESTECPEISKLSLTTTELDNDSSIVSSSAHSVDRSHPAEPITTPTDSMSISVLHLQSDTRTHLCIVCGCSGPKRCGRCAKVHYCSKEHQTHDWVVGHKKYCGDLSSNKMTVDDLRYTPSKGIVLPEYEIVTELEPDLISHGNGKSERSEEERMTDYHKYIKSVRGVASGKGGGASELSTKALKDVAMSEHNTDKQFRAFKKRVAIEPEQVIRYQRDGQPLLVSDKGAPGPRDIPNCSCGAQRKFEFQIMPQLLYYLKLDSVSGPSIDWGTLIVYTCSSSGSSKVGCGYKEEVIWRQDFA